MKAAELAEKLQAWEEVNEDILMDEVMVPFVSVKGKFDGDDGAFFFQTDDGVYYLPYFDDVDGSGDDRPSAYPENLEKAGEAALHFLRQQAADSQKETAELERLIAQTENR